MGITIIDLGHDNDFFSIIFDAISHLTSAKHLNSVNEWNTILKKKL